MAEHNVSKCLKSHQCQSPSPLRRAVNYVCLSRNLKRRWSCEGFLWFCCLFLFFLSPEMIWCEVISRTVRLHDTTLTKNKSEAKCSVTRVPGVNFGTTFKCALFLQELISMHWWPRITTANYGNMPGYRADPILRAAPTCPLQTWNKLIYFRGKVWGRSFYFYLGLSGT